MKGFECLILHAFQHTKTFDAILDGIDSSVASESYTHLTLPTT